MYVQLGSWYVIDEAICPNFSITGTISREWKACEAGIICVFTELFVLPQNSAKRTMVSGVLETTTSSGELIAAKSIQRWSFRFAGCACWNLEMSDVTVFNDVLRAIILPA